MSQGMETMLPLLDAATEPERSAALVLIPKASFPTIIAADTTDILGRLLKEVEGFEGDATTVRGRAEIGSKVQKARVARADFRRLADSLKEDAIKTQRNVNAEFKVLDERMEGLIQHLDSERQKYVAAESARTKANEDAIAAMEALTDGLADLSPDEIQARAASIQPFDYSVEFKAKAEKVRAGVIAQLKVAYGGAVRREADADAVRRLAIEQAEFDRLAAIEAQRIREEQIAAEATRLAEIEAAQKAEEAKVAAQALLDAAEAREREKAEELRATEARLETIRIDNHKDALARIKLLATKTDGLSLRDIDDRLERVDVLTQREWEEFAEEAQSTADATCEFLTARRGETADRLEAARVAAHEAALAEFATLAISLTGQPSSDAVTQAIATLQRLHANRNWEEFTERATTARADTLATFRAAYQTAKAREKRAADAEAERLRLEAVEIERQRVARETAKQKAEDDRRAANKAHRAAINREVVEAIEAVLKSPLFGVGTTRPTEFPPETMIARALVTAIAKGEIPHVGVTY